MNKDEKLKELEEKQRALADEIRALREDKKEFVRGKFYKGKNPGTVVVATSNKGSCKSAFSGINISNNGVFDLVDDNGWTRDVFTEVIPKWLTSWELKNPERIDFSKPEHDTDEIPDWWLCECWDDDDTHGREIKFFDKENECSITHRGAEDGVDFENYRMIPAEEWPEWARDAWRNK